MYGDLAGNWRNLEFARRFVPVVGLEEMRRKPEEFEEDALAHFILSITSGILRQGLSFKAFDDSSSGIRVRLVDKNIEIELTDKSIASLLLQHLQPRFRAFLEGIVK